MKLEKCADNEAYLTFEIKMIKLEKVNDLDNDK